MATAILIVAILILASVMFLGWQVWRRYKWIGEWQTLERNRAVAAAQEVYAMRQDMQTIRDVLTKASQIKAAKQPDSVFDRDTMPPTVSRRFVPLAVRRAQAEAASMGPVTHADKVRENNAKAIESAG